jgi:hypothetical protein
MKQDKDKFIEAFRAVAHRHLDQWVDLQTDMLTADKMPTLRQISDQFSQTCSTSVCQILAPSVLDVVEIM